MSLLRTIVAFSFCVTAAVAEEPLVVELVTATKIADVQKHSLTGEIAARDTLTASFSSGGRIAEVLVQEGDVVAVGAPLVRMDSVQQEQALRAAQAGLSTANADHRQAIEDLERQRTLLERGATTRISRDTAEDALHIAQGAVTQARSDLARAQKALTDTVLLAPTAATVIERMVEPGQVVGAASPVLELALGDQVDAVFDVPEVMMSTGSDRSKIALELIDHPGPQFSGVTREISPLVDSLTGTVSVTVSVIDPPLAMTYGDAVRGTATSEAEALIVLPYSAMAATVDGPAVWVVDAEAMTVSLRQISVNRFETERILVDAGLEEGTLVVTRGAQLLYPGRIVRQAGDSK